MLGQQTTTGDWTAFLSANQAVVELSAAVLPQLLSECRRLRPSREPSTGCNSNSSSSTTTTCGANNSSSSDSRLLDSCQSVAFTLATAWHVQATTAEQQAGSAAATLGQQIAPERIYQSLQPVSYSECCKLLQICVRLVAAEKAAAAAAPSGSTDDSSCSSKPTSKMLRSVTSLLGDPSLLGDLRRPTDPFLSTSGPLVAPLAAAGDVSSIEAMQLFGLLCSMLKLYSNSSISTDMLADTKGLAKAEQQEDAAIAAALSMLSTALGVGSSRAQPGSSHNSSGNNSTSSPASSRACAAALPWLWLLGRYCCACSVLVQQWQVSLVPDGQGVNLKHNQWRVYRFVLAKTLLQLQLSLANVVQGLAAAGTIEQLTALGHQPQDMQQQLAGAAEALETLCKDLPTAEPVGGGGTTPLLKEIHKQLQAASTVLACFAVPHACNNPACSNVSGPSEAQLVGGRSCICAGCRIARYCGRGCQRAMWRQHKPVCQALAAAAEVAAAAGGVAESAAEGGSGAAK
jgi:hypothetical protein